MCVQKEISTAKKTKKNSNKQDALEMKFHQLEARSILWVFNRDSCPDEQLHVGFPVIRTKLEIGVTGVSYCQVHKVL